ncbi:MAG: Uma2 family endonuclease [Chloroflexota bacterium]|nr:Uma2 family endonuclease [Chloroflexota bacterium]
MPQEKQEKRIWTANDLLALTGDENSYELVRGELIVMTPASAYHGKFAARLVRALGDYVEKQALGEVYTAEPGFELESDPQTIRAPDVAFVRQERIPPEGEPEGFWAIAPDLVIEIVSPSETAQMIHEKVTDYVRAGTRMLWLIYPASQTAMEYRPPTDARWLTVEDDLDGGDVVSGFRYPLKKLFA